MNKKTSYTIKGALWTGAGNALLNIFRQVSEIGINPQQKFELLRVLSAFGKGSLLGGAAGLGLGAVRDYQNAKIIPVNTDKKIRMVVERVKLNPLSPAHLNLSSKADFIAAELGFEFGEALKRPPVKMGSCVHGTALKKQSDIDLALLFKPMAFASTADMYHTVKCYLENNMQRLKIVSVATQKKSLAAHMVINGQASKIDIVPCKLTKGRRTSGYLYKNKPGMFFDDTGYTKTDIPLLNKNMLSTAQKEVLIAMKQWKNLYDVPISSHLLQNMILDTYACNKGNIPYGISEKIIMVMDHISQNLEYVRLRSVENSNNVLTKMNDSDKRAIVKACEKVVNDYNYQPNSILCHITVE